MKYIGTGNDLVKVTLVVPLSSEIYTGGDLVHVTLVLVAGEGDAGGDLVQCPGMTLVALVFSEIYTGGDLVQVKLVLVAGEGYAGGDLVQVATTPTSPQLQAATSFKQQDLGVDIQIGSDSMNLYIDPYLY